MFLNRIQIDKERIRLLKELEEKAFLAFASSRYSKLDFLAISKRLTLEELPGIVNITSISFKAIPLVDAICNVFGSGKIPYISLYHGKSLKRQYIEGDPSPLEALIEAQARLNKPIYIIPTCVIYKRSLNKLNPSIWDVIFGYADNLGPVRKTLIFMTYGKECFLSIGQPIPLHDTSITYGSVREKEKILKAKILEAIDVEKAVYLGPVVKDREKIKEQVLEDKKVIDVIEQFAKGDIKATKRAKKEAEKYFEEIAADYSPFYAQLFLIFLRWLWNKIFEGIDIVDSQLIPVKDAARKATLVYVPSHRSHIDYLVLNYMLHKNLLHSPRIAAGVNLLFWPMGKLFRKAGAFFIRRSFRGAKLYTAVFTSYIRMLIEEGYPIEFFIEGGRSRTGKLVKPKAGLLTLILQSYMETKKRDIAFVPVSIVYDKVLEDEEYVKELKGQEKQKESTRQFLSSVKFLKKKYGKVYIRFGKPIYASEYLETNKNIELDDQSQKLADLIAENINKITVVTPLNLISAAILSKFRSGFTIEELTNAVEIYLSYLRDRSVEVSTTFNDIRKAIDHTIALLRQWDIIQDIGDRTKSYWGLKEDKRIVLDYYKNGLLHHILPCSLLCLTLNARGKVSQEVALSDIKFLKFILQNEFVFEDEDELFDIRRAFKFLVNSRLGYFDSSGFFRFTKVGRDSIILFLAPISGILEVYWIASKEAIRLLEEQGRISRIMPKNIFKMVTKYTKLDVIRYPESINQITVSNAVNFFNTTIKSQKLIEKYLGEGADIYSLNRQIEIFLRPETG